MLNNPIRYNDPTGHRVCGDGEEYDCDGHTQDPNANPYPHKSRHKGRDLSLLIGLKPNTCTDNACTLPPLITSGSSGSNTNNPDYCSPGIKCQLDIGPWKSFNIDFGLLYIQQEISTNFSGYDQNGSPFTVSNQGAKVYNTDFTPWEETVYSVELISKSIDIGNIGHGSFSYGVGISNTLSITSYNEIAYEINTQNLSGGSVTRTEAGSRPLILVAVYILSQIGKYEMPRQLLPQVVH